MKKQQGTPPGKKKDTYAKGKKILVRLLPGVIAASIALGLGAMMQQALKIPAPSDISWDGGLTLSPQTYGDLSNNDLFTLPLLTEEETFPVPTFSKTEDLMTFENGEETLPPQTLSGDREASAPAEQKPQAEPKTEPSPAPAVAPARIFVPPVEGETVTVFQPDRLCWNDTLKDWRVHEGIDLACEAGTPVRAISDGTVVLITDAADTGITVSIDHGDGLISVLGGLSLPLTVSVGQRVETGTVVGHSAGAPPFEMHDVPHVHVELIRNGEQTDPCLWWTRPQT